MPTAADFTTAPQEELAPWAEEMLAEQESVQPQAEPSQKDPAANDVLLFELPALAAGDAQGLAELIIAHPDLYEEILQTAAGMLGNETLSKALDIVHGAPAQENAVQAPQAAEPTPPQVVEEQAAEATTAGTNEVTPAQVHEEQAEAHVEPGWVVRARAFNANHADEVQLFNHATGYGCVGADGQLDPNAVANWQAANGVSPDGRCGKQTADAAWALMPVEAPKAPVYTLPDDIPPPQ